MGHENLELTSTVPMSNEDGRLFVPDHVRKELDLSEGDKTTVQITVSVVSNGREE